MRNIDVVLFWANGIPARTCNMWTDGKIITSYAVRIGMTNSRGKKVALDYTGLHRISMTTSTHVGKVKRYADYVVLPDAESEFGFSFQGEYDE